MAVQKTGETKKNPKAATKAVDAKKGVKKTAKKGAQKKAK